jgi:hypothetical protein
LAHTPRSAAAETTFEGKPLFPERRASTLPCELSEPERDLYEAVTQYMREQMNRAEQLKAVGEGRRGPCTDSGVSVVPAPRGAVGLLEPEPRDVRFYGVVRVNPERYGRDFTRVAQEVLQHLAAVDGTRLEVTVEITATNDVGFPPDKACVVTEKARTLKLDLLGFEDR